MAAARAALEVCSLLPDRCLGVWTAAYRPYTEASPRAALDGLHELLAGDGVTRGCWSSPPRCPDWLTADQVSTTLRPAATHLREQMRRLADRVDDAARGFVAGVTDPSLAALDTALEPAGREVDRWGDLGDSSSRWRSARSWSWGAPRRCGRGAR